MCWTIKQQKDLIRKSFNKYRDCKRKDRENVGLLNGAEDPMAKEKDKVPASPQSFLVSPAFRMLRLGEDCSQEVLALEKEDQGQGPSWTYKSRNVEGAG